MSASSSSSSSSTPSAQSAEGGGHAAPETGTTASSPTYTRLEPNAAGLATAGELLRKGRLVAFPTETVYGLGANALDADAVLSIFKCKGRPLTDPLIVHIAEASQAEDLVELDEAAASLFKAFTTKFWPGPLTLVAKSKPKLPLLLSAGTGFVGIRLPQHPIARAMLRAAGVPVAAPSANRFGHVSPTLAAHVIKDLGFSTVGGGIAVVDNDKAAAAIADGNASNGPKDAGFSDEASCGVGIESTVAKIDSESGEVVVFRRGGVSQAALQAVIDEGGFPFKIRCLSKKASESQKGLQAPGQMLTHYAPDVDTYLVRGAVDAATDSSSDAASGVAVLGTPVDDNAEALGQAEMNVDISKCVVIDFQGALAPLRALQPLAYRDMSDAGDMKEAAQQLFKSLRWSEQQEGATRVLLADVADCEHEDTAAVRDRMYRAASGKQLSLRVSSTPAASESQ